MKRLIISLAFIASTQASAQYYGDEHDGNGTYTTNNLGGGIGIVSGPNGYSGTEINLGGGVKTYSDNRNRNCTTINLGGGMTSTNCN